MTHLAPWILLLTLLLAALGFGMFFNGSDDVFYAPFVLCLTGFAAVLLAPGLWRGWALPKSATVIAVLLFWLYLIVSHLWASTPYISTMFTIILSILPGLFFAIVLAQDPEKAAQFCQVGVSLVITGFAVWALVQFFVFYEDYGPRIKHPMVNPNNLGALFNLALLPVLGLFLVASPRRVLVVAALAFAVLYGGVLVTQSRGALLTFIIGAILLTLFYIIQKRKEGGISHLLQDWKRWGALAAMLIGVPALIYLLAPEVAGNGVNDYVNSVANVKESYSVQNRFLLWGSTWEIVKENFWLGTGLGSFYFYFPRFRHPEDISDGFFAHMDPLQFWAEMGVLAPVLFYGVLICVLLRTVHAVRATDDFKSKMAVLAPFVGMLAVTLHTHLSFHLYMPAILIPMAALLAVWYVATEKALGGARIRFGDVRAWRLGVGLVTLGIFVVAGGWATRASLGIYWNQKVAKSITARDEATASEYVEMMRKWAPSSFRRPYELSAQMRVNRLTNTVNELDKAATAQIYNEAMYLIEEAEKRNPAYTRLWDMRARLYYAVDGKVVHDGYGKAVETLEEVLEFNPMALNSRIGLALIHKKRGDLDKAWEVLAAGMNIPRVKGSAEVRYYAVMAIVRGEMGDEEGSLALGKEAGRLRDLYAKQAAAGR